MLNLCFLVAVPEFRQVYTFGCWSPLVQNPPANARDAGSIPGSGRCPGVGSGNPVFLPGKFHGQRGTWWATVHESESDTAEGTHTYIRVITDIIKIESNSWAPPIFSFCHQPFPVPAALGNHWFVFWLYTVLFFLESNINGIMYLLVFDSSYSLSWSLYMLLCV